MISNNLTHTTSLPWTQRFSSHVFQKKSHERKLYRWNNQKYIKNACLQNWGQLINKFFITKLLLPTKAIIPFAFSCHPVYDWAEIGHQHDIAHLQASEDNFQVCILSFRHVGSGLKLSRSDLATLWTISWPKQFLRQTVKLKILLGYQITIMVQVLDWLYLGIS